MDGLDGLAAAWPNPPDTAGGLPKAGFAPKAGDPPNVGVPPNVGAPPKVGVPPKAGLLKADAVGEPKPVVATLPPTG